MSARIITSIVIDNQTVNFDFTPLAQSSLLYSWGRTAGNQTDYADSGASWYYGPYPTNNSAYYAIKQGSAIDNPSYYITHTVNKFSFNFGKQSDDSYVHVDTSDYHFSRRFTANGMATIAFLVDDNQKLGQMFTIFELVSGSTTRLNIIAMTNCSESVYKALMFAYDWEAVISISGKGKTYPLSQIKSSAINDGESVTGASASDFETLTSDSLVSKFIDDAMQDASNVTVKYTIPQATYSYIKLVYKKGSIPTSYSDGTAIDILQTDTESIISGIADGDTYYFEIFTDKSTSEPKSIKTIVGGD